MAPATDVICFRRLEVRTMADPPHPGPHENEPDPPETGGDATAGDAHERLAAHMAGRLGSADHVERLDVLSADEHAKIQGGLAEAMHDRLAALDLLYERGEISASELGAARQRILEATGAPPGGAAGGPRATDETVITPPPTAQPAAAPPPPQEPGPGGGPTPPDGPSEGKRILGMPLPAALGVLAAIIVVVAGAAALLITQPWSSDEQEAAPAATEQVAEGYLGQIETPYGRLTDSAVSIGKTLARVSTPADLKRLGRNADRQLDVVENARKTLSGMSVADEDRAAHQALLAASATQRRYLVTLSRSVSLAPEQGLELVPQVRSQADSLESRYGVFFALVPEAPDAITGSDLDDTAGLKAALTEAEARAQELAEPEPEPEPATPSPTPTPSPGIVTGTAFSSPTGNLRCTSFGTSLRCSSANDGFSATLPEFGSPTTGSGAIEGGGQIVPYGSDWVSGPFRCDSETAGITCRSVSSGRGFFLSRDTYTPF